MPTYSKKILLALTDKHRTQLTRLLFQPDSTFENTYHYVWCDNPKRALELIEQQGFDLLVISSDFDPDGSTLLPGLRRLPGSPGIIYLGDHWTPHTDSLLEQGVQEILALDRMDHRSLVSGFQAALSREAALRQKVLQSQSDVLTGLINRSQFEQCLQDAITHARESQLPFAVMLLNLDAFSALNNNYGPKVGDQLILRTKERIQRVVGSKPVVARVGSDEFAILIEKLFSAMELTRLTARLQDVVATPVIIGSESAYVSSSIGLAIYPQAGEDPNSLMKNAATALKVAKRDPNSTFRRFKKDMEEQESNRYRLGKQLRQALTRDELELHYQPRIDLLTGKIVGAEALVRWNHPERGLLGPDAFIPIAEESDLIVPLGYWVMDRACQDWQTLNEWGFRDVHLAINLSFQQFHDKSLASTVAETVEKHQINPKYLEFELTETTVMHDPQAVSRTMKEISKSGITFSLDDFGTGYSSFANIISLPIKLLKIDRSFVSGLQDGGNQAVIVQSIITLAHSLNMKVVSEGVELPMQHHLLVDLNCDQCQGYYFSKPLPFETFCRHLTDVKYSQELLLAEEPL